MEQEISKLKNEVDELKKEINKLRSTATIPWDIDQAFRNRLLGNVKDITVSSKGASTEDITAVTSVDFVGSSTTTDSVLGDPDAFLQVTISGTVYYIPVFT